MVSFCKGEELVSSVENMNNNTSKQSFCLHCHIIHFQAFDTVKEFFVGRRHIRHITGKAHTANSVLTELMLCHYSLMIMKRHKSVDFGQRETFPSEIGLLLNALHSWVLDEITEHPSIVRVIVKVI